MGSFPGLNFPQAHFIGIAGTMFNAAGQVGPPPVFSITHVVVNPSLFFLQLGLLTPTAAHSLTSILSSLPFPSLSSAMPSRRARASSVSDDEIHDLVLKLSALLPPPNQRRTASAWRILQETCSYIKRLQREVDDLSERLSQLLDSLDSNNNGVEVEHLRSLLQQ